MEKIIFNNIANYIDWIDGDTLIELYPNRYKKKTENYKRYLLWFYGNMWKQYLQDRTGRQ